MPDRFPSPFEIVAPTGAEGWEELYGYSTVFSEDRREMEESMFWFMDGVHTPEVIEPWDATVLDYAITFLGQYTTRHYVIPPALGGYDSTRRPYPFDQAKARSLLAQAGHPNGIHVELWTGTGNPIFVRMAETMQAYLNAVGIRTKIVLRESAAARAAARKGEADMILKDWYADYPDAENFLFPLLHSANKGAGGNVSFYANPRFDSVVTASRRELDEAKRNALYRTADSIAYADAPMVFLYFYNELYAVQPWIKGWVPPVIFNGQRWLNATIEHAARNPPP